MDPDVRADVAYRINRARICLETGWTFDEFDDHTPTEIDEVMVALELRADPDLR